MGIVFYDLKGRDGRNFSPYCWRTRMALAHKDLDFEHRGTSFTEIKYVVDGQFQTVPVLENNGEAICDSNNIAKYLETHFPERPSLFGGIAGEALCRFIHSWTNAVVHPGVARSVIFDIYEHVCDHDRDYFVASREKIFGMPLAEAQAVREDYLEEFRRSLYPLRLTVKNQLFLGGEHPNYADYIVYGAFQWARTISDFRLLAEDDPVFLWFTRVGNLFDGLGRTAPGYY